MDFKTRSVSTRIQVILITLQCLILGIILSEKQIRLSIFMFIDMFLHFLIQIIFKEFCKVRIIQHLLICFMMFQYKKFGTEKNIYIWLWNLITMMNLLQTNDLKTNFLSIFLNSLQLYIYGFHWITLSCVIQIFIAKMYHIFISKVENSLYSTLFEFILDSFSNCTLELDSNHQIVFASKSLFGYTPQQLLHQSLWNIIMDSKQEALQHLEKVFTTKITQKWNWEIGEKTFRARASPINKSDHVLLSLTETMGSVKKLEESLKSKNLFISSISHELRNPLQSITYSLQLLYFTNLTTVSKKFIKFYFLRDNLHM